MAEDSKTDDKGETKSKPHPVQASAGSGADTCRAEGCKQPVRAKGYCRKHFMAWRRGAVGEHHRYKICSKEGCRKPRTKGSLCDEHAGLVAPASEGAPPA
jgi:hypothetical protein